MISQLRRIRPLTDTYRNLWRRLHWRQARPRLEALATSPDPLGPKLAGSLLALDQRLPAAERAWARRIEGERRRLAHRHEPLADGSLGSTGPFDAGKSVADANEVSIVGASAPWLMLLVRACRPLRVLELGTNVGISSAYIAAALELNGSDGRLLSLDASRYRQRQAAGVQQSLGLDRVDFIPGLFTETLDLALQRLGQVDLAFIDGHHQYQPTLDYFERILKHATPDTVFVFDDISWSDGMRKAWAEIESDPRLGLVVNLGRIGVAAAHRGHRLVTGPLSRF